MIAPIARHERCKRMNKAEETMAKGIFEFIKGNFGEEMTEDGIEVTNANEEKFLLAVSEKKHPALVKMADRAKEKMRKSCSGCDNWPICTVRENMDTLLRSMGSVTRGGSGTDIFEFVASRCILFKRAE